MQKIKDLKKNIYIYYEFYKREFLSNLLLSTIASKNNLKVYIGTNQVFNVLHKKKLINPGIFHTKSLSHGEFKSKFHKDLKKNNFLLTCIDEEHGVIDKGSFDDLFIKPRIHSNDLDLCSAFFCWGKFDYNHLKNKFRKKVFYMTGSPRVDLWKTKFNFLWKTNLNKKKYFLFVSNFSFPNNHYSFKDIIKRKKYENYYKRSPNLLGEEIKYYNYQKASMIKFTRLIKSFSKKFPNEIIYLRPHPTEKIDYWKKHLNNIKNVFIKPEGELSFYIRGAECVIQDGCSSGIESYISNIPVINYLPIKSNKHAFGQFIKKFAINIFNEKSFFKIIKLKKYKVLKNKKKIVNNRMLFLDKKLSANKIVEVWKKLLNSNYYIKNQKSNIINNDFKIYIYLFFYDILKTITTNTILFFKRQMHLKKIFQHKNEKLDIIKISKSLNLISSSLKIKNNFKIKKLSKDLICISLAEN